MFNWIRQVIKKAYIMYLSVAIGGGMMELGGLDHICNKRVFRITTRDLLICKSKCWGPHPRWLLAQKLCFLLPILCAIIAPNIGSKKHNFSKSKIIIAGLVFTKVNIY